MSWEDDCRRESEGFDEFGQSYGFHGTIVKGQLGVPLTVWAPWYLAGVL